MSVQSKERLKSYFKKGAYPTESQFSDLIDSMRHSGELLGTSDIRGLENQLNGKFPATSGNALLRRMSILEDTVENIETDDPEARRYKVHPFDRIVERVGSANVVEQSASGVQGEDYEIVYVSGLNAFLAYVASDSEFGPGTFYAGALPSGYQGSNLVTVNNIMVATACASSLYVCDGVVYVPFNGGLLRVDNGVLQMKGVAGGIAELDANGKVAEKQLPRTVCMFDGIIRSLPGAGDNAVPILPMEGSGKSSTDEGCAVFWLEGQGRFVFEDPDNPWGYYGTWADGNEYGEETPTGVIPVKGKIYVCAGSVYVWDGTKLSAESADVQKALNTLSGNIDDINVKLGKKQEKIEEVLVSDLNDYDTLVGLKHISSVKIKQTHSHVIGYIYKIGYKIGNSLYYLFFASGAFAVEDGQLIASNSTQTKVPFNNFILTEFSPITWKSYEEYKKEREGDDGDMFKKFPSVSVGDLNNFQIVQGIIRLPDIAGTCTYCRVMHQNDMVGHLFMSPAAENDTFYKYTLIGSFSLNSNGAIVFDATKFDVFHTEFDRFNTLKWSKPLSLQKGCTEITVVDTNNFVLAEEQGNVSYKGAWSVDGIPRPGYEVLLRSGQNSAKATIISVSDVVEEGSHRYNCIAVVNSAANFAKVISFVVVGDDIIDWRVEEIVSVKDTGITFKTGNLYDSIYPNGVEFNTKILAKGKGNDYLMPVTVIDGDDVRKGFYQDMKVTIFDEKGILVYMVETTENTALLKPIYYFNYQNYTIEEKFVADEDFATRLLEDNDLLTLLAGNKTFVDTLVKKIGKQDTLLNSKDITVDANKLSITEEAKRAVFNDMWDALCTTYNMYGNKTVNGKYDPDNAPDAEHPYLLNRIWMTYEEAMSVASVDRIRGASGNNCLYMGKKIRTNPPHGDYWTVYQDTYMTFKGATVEVAYCSKVAVGSYMFENCSKLHTIIGSLHCSTSSPTNAFFGCTALKELKLVIGTGTVSLSYSPLIDLESWKYMINNKSQPDKSATLIVHPDVYAKLTGDTTNAAAAALTDEELAQWAAVLDAAVAKNIAFATA